MTFTDAPIENEVDLANPDSVAKAVAGDQPEIAPPEDPIVELPRGIWYEGSWQTKVELKELTGEDEERFTRFKDDELFVNILASGVNRIGTIDVTEKPQAEQEQILQSLLVGEQMILLVNIVRVTFGNEREFNWTCMACQSKNVTTLIMSEDFVAEVPDNILDDHVYTDSKGNEINYIPACGVHLAELNIGMTQGTVNTKMLARLITRVNGEVPFSLAAFAKNMGMKDRRDLLNAIDKLQPIIDWNMTIACSSCGEEQTTALSWGDLFRI